MNYKALAQAASDVSLAMGKEIQMKRLDYASWIEQEIAVSPVKIAEVKLFNPQGRSFYFFYHAGCSDFGYSAIIAFRSSYFGRNPARPLR